MNNWKNLTNDGAWFHAKDKYSYAKVWKPALSVKERRKRGINTYGFAARIGLLGKEVREFYPKKSLALARAKNWMSYN